MRIPVGWIVAMAAGVAYNISSLYSSLTNAR
jgi:hypothetical protein